jgi:cytochrome-b5 reductase
MGSLQNRGAAASNIACELGWVSEEKISRHAFPPAVDTRVFVCGLPGVYLKLCGPRTTRALSPHSALHELGYSDDMVVKF